MDASTFGEPCAQVVRQKWFSSALMLAECEVGAWARECWRLHKIEVEADTLPNVWERSWNAGHRKTIFRALDISPEDPCAAYATHPFRIIQHDTGAWIAAATWPPKWFKPSKIWAHLDIGEVLLWNPRTGEARAEDIFPAEGLTVCEQVTVFGDAKAFLRAWADQRAETFARMVQARRYDAEPADGDLPGIFTLVPDRLRWREADAAVLKAGPGVAAIDLKRAVYRGLPRVQG